MFQQTPGADWTPFGRPALGPRKVRDKETMRGTKRKTRSPRQRLEMVVRVRPVLALIFVPLFAQPPRQTIYHNEGNGSFEQNSLAPGKSLQQWFVRHELARFPTFSFAVLSLSFFLLLHLTRPYVPFFLPCFTRSFAFPFTRHSVAATRRESNRTNL